MSQAHLVSARPSLDHVDLTWSDGRVAALASFWLKLQTTTSTAYVGIAERWTDGANFHPPDDSIRDDDRIADARVEGDYLTVRWDDGSQHRFSAGGLWQRVFAADPAEAIKPVAWDAKLAVPAFAYDRVMTDDDTVLELCREFLRLGLVVIHGVPRQLGQCVTVSERLSTLHRSHLGDTFTVRAKPPGEETIHIGETRDAIPLHIDLVYKQHPPELQLLHALTQIDHGGENEFVDALHIITKLDPADLQLLRDIPVDFVARSETVHFRGRHPILTFDRQDRFVGVHYNEYKIELPPETPNAYYGAFRRFQALIKRPENVCVILLPQDSMVLLHNRRTLHGRRAFGPGPRHYEGCFLSDDDLRSTYRTLVRDRAGRSSPAAPDVRG